MKRIDPLTLYDWLKQKEDVQLIDVREEDEWNICRLPEADWIPMHKIPASGAQIKTDCPVIVYCHHGIRSAHCIMYLEEQGDYDNLYNLDGGIDAWSRAIDNDMPRY